MSAARSLPLLFVLLVHGAPAAAESQAAAPDPWAPVRFLVGDWTGTAEGEPGKGTVERSYAFALDDRFLEERNVSRYAPRKEGEPAEVHEHRSFLSYDGKRATLVLRQFHEEGFVNLYSLSAGASGPAKLVFDSEGFENFDSAWKARETYEIVSKDEFVETFELAPPGKPYEVYSRSRFQRAGTAAAAVPAYDEALAKSVGADDRGMRGFVLVILKTGPTRVPDGPARDEMFRGHFANMQRLSDEGKLAFAGPLDGVDGWRGLFVLAVPEVDEAKPIVATDPVIRNGEMVPEFHKLYGSAALMRIRDLHARIQKQGL